MVGKHEPIVTLFRIEKEVGVHCVDIPRRGKNIKIIDLWSECCGEGDPAFDGFIEEFGGETNVKLKQPGSSVVYSTNAAF